MTNDLIDSIERQLNIPKSNDDTQICRIVYSVAGQMALTSLWDRKEDNSSISIQHFKNRISQIIDAYEGIFPKIKHYFSADRSDLIDDMYSIYLRTGFLYHSAYQISPAISAQACCEKIVLYRGISSDVQMYMSGMGFYGLNEKSSDNTVASLFGLQIQSFDDYLDQILTHNEWEFIEWPENAEFLRMDPPFSRGYWQQSPDKNQKISLARYGEPNKLFVLYRYHQGRYQQKTIPEWMLRDWFSNEVSYGEYRRIAVALLKRYNTLPAIRVKIIEDLVEIKVGYRFPPSEEEFFKLYSWPVRYDYSSNSPQVFTRIMAKSVYPVFKFTMETLGYCFLEE